MYSTLAATMLVQTLVMIGVVAVPVLAPLVASSLSLPTEFSGPYQSLAFAGATVMTLVAGTLVRRFGGLRISQVCCLISGLGMFASASGQIVLVVAGCITVGAAYGMATPGASHVLARVTAARFRGIVFSVKQSAVTLGGLLAGLILPPLATHVGWQAALCIGASVALVAIALIHPLRRTLDDDRAPNYPISFSNVFGNIKLVWNHPTLRPISLVAFTYATIQVTLFALYVTFLVEKVGYSLIEAGWLYAVMQGSGIVARIGWGALTDRWVSSRIALACLGIGAVIGTSILAHATEHWSWSSMVALSTLLGATAVGWNGIYLAEIPRQVAQEDVSSATSGTVAFSFFGIVVGPASFAAIVAWSDSYLLPFGMFNAVVLASVVYLLLSQAKPSS